MDLNKKIETIEKEIKIINEKLDKIVALLETDCNKMSDHIDFIEGVYDHVKHPLNYVMNTISHYISENNQIEDDNTGIANC